MTHPPIPILRSRHGSMVVDGKPEPVNRPTTLKASEDRDLKRRVHEQIWRTQDGRDLKITEMESSHLNRTIAWIKRNQNHSHPVAKEYIRQMQQVLKQRDDF